MRPGQLPPLNWLRSFEAAARHLSFTTAGTELGITQSAVSQQIKALEDTLGRTLFIRRARSLQLTDTARVYLPAVQSAFETLISETAALVGQDEDARLDIHANMAFTIFWLAPRLGTFLDLHPWIRLNVATSVWTSENVAPYASVEIRFGAGRWEGQTGEKFAQGEMFPVCAPWVANTLSTPRDLHDLRLIDTPGLRQGWDQWLMAAGVPDGMEIERHWASTYVMTFEMARQGTAIALAHSPIVDGHLKDGRLVRPFDIAIPMQDAYYLITPPNARLNAAARTFREWLLEQSPLT